MKRVLILLALCGALGPRAALSETVEPAPSAGSADAPTLKLPAPQTRPDAGARAPETSPAPVAEEQAPATTEADTGGISPDAPQAGATDLLPPPFPLSRYEPLWKRSPFQLESVAPPVASEGLGQRFALTGIAEINGDPIAFLFERATQTRHMIDSKENQAGLSLVSVDVAKTYTESTATVRMGGEVGVIKFDLAATAQGAVPPPGMPGIPSPAPVPGIPPSVPPVQAQTAPGIVPPVPGPGVPAPGQVQPPEGQGNMPPPRVIRRRALIPAAP